MPIPTLPKWPDSKSPVICTVKSLERTISPDRYGQVYWIAKLVDNIIIESCPLEAWFFASDGRLIGEVDFAAWQRTVEIALDEYVILGLL